MQRPSEPQLIADELDNIIPFVRREFDADGRRSPQEQTILNGLIDLSNRSQRHAEVVDLAVSVVRIGHTKRNDRRIRELFPEFDPAA